MRTLALALLLLAAVPRLAAADGWIHCSGPDKPACNASGADSGAVGVSLLLVAGVAYGITRRKRR